MVFLPFAVAFLASLGISDAQNPPGATPPDAVSPLPPPRNLTNQERGDIFMARKMYREAIEVYSEGARTSAVLCNKMGIAYHQLAQLDKAKNAYERALRLDPRYAEAQNNIGTAEYSKKSYRRAVNAYKKAVQMMPDSASFHKNLGTALFARKQLEAAIAEYATALKLDPNVFESRGSMGTVLEGGYVEEKAQYHYTIAKVYGAAGRIDLALQYLRRALEEGFKDKKKMEEDPEFAAMRQLPEFKELLALEPRVL